MLPERYDHAAPPYVSVIPERRWFVPAGLVVPSGSAEYAACRALAARGLLKAGSVGPQPGLPNGQGGYLLTRKGRLLLEGRTFREVATGPKGYPWTMKQNETEGTTLATVEDIERVQRYVRSRRPTVDIRPLSKRAKRLEREGRGS